MPPLFRTFSLRHHHQHTCPSIQPCIRPPIQVEYVKGWGTIKGPNLIDVALLDGGSRTLAAKNIIIATGSEVTPLPGVTVDEER